MVFTAITYGAMILSPNIDLRGKLRSITVSQLATSGAGAETVSFPGTAADLKSLSSWLWGKNIRVKAVEVECGLTAPVALYALLLSGLAPSLAVEKAPKIIVTNGEYAALEFSDAVRCVDWLGLPTLVTGTFGLVFITPVSLVATDTITTTATIEVVE